MHVSHIEIPKQHPNNFQRFIMRETYNAGGTHYEILFSEKDRKDRPISGEFNIYYCQEKPEEVVKQPVVQQAIQPQMPYVININNQ
ncbi:hypothetical protein C0W93_12390 [Photobacterium leiognathi subsp. mandapamensis]|uniref:Uncharacterized protein n=3 Tax=Photobacterium leiognathi TaxID=553611 RepID=A0A2T3KU30_PHOLD|nr:hypothetical protein C0W93_12390 [Photobacterium leiognathi subsp. mandapamensis]